MTGTQGTDDALVGVIEASIQRGSLVQEPFYWALTSILKQAYEHIATVGKAVYFDNPRKLAMMVGDKGMANIILTKDHLLQDYRIFMNRSETKEQGETAGNQLLFTLLQAGLIDQNLFSNMFNRATPDRIAKEMRAFIRTNNQAQNQIDKAQVAGAAMADQKEKEMVQGMVEAEAKEGETAQINEQVAHERELEKIAFKEKLKNEGRA
jgi:UDP-2,3-diacylglucosamine pyrophosphatase LpxH